MAYYKFIDDDYVPPITLMGAIEEGVRIAKAAGRNSNYLDARLAALLVVKKYKGMFDEAGLRRVIEERLSR